MRQPPSDIPPLVHDGIRYEAPHWSREAQEGAERLRIISGHLEKAMRSSITGGKLVDPQDTGWLREALKDCPVSQSEVDAYLDLMAFQATVAPVMMRVTQKLLSRSFPEGLPTLEGPDLRAALEEDGTLTADQIERVVNDITGPFGNLGRPRNGGRLVAYDQASGEQLWELEVYPPADSDLFVTELALEGGHLLVRDESGREHRVDLKERRVADL